MWRPCKPWRRVRSTIGKLVDSADDMARLMIVTQYAGTKTVKVYASDGVVDANSNSGGYNPIQVSDTPTTTDDVFAI